MYSNSYHLWRHIITHRNIHPMVIKFAGHRHNFLSKFKFSQRLRKQRGYNYFCVKKGGVKENMQPPRPPSNLSWSGDGGTHPSCSFTHIQNDFHTMGQDRAVVMIKVEAHD